MTVRRRRNRFLRSLFIFAVVAAGFTAVVVGGWGKFTRTDAYKLLTGTLEKPAQEAIDPDLWQDGGFHMVDQDYWLLFDEAAVDDKPAPAVTRPEEPTGGTPPHRPPTPDPKIPPRKDRVSAEGLTVRPMKNTGPYSINGDMGGLIATRVGVWKSPNRLGTGAIAFYCEHLEDVKVTHWAKNMLGFRVYRVLKEGRAGWVLGNSLLEENGETLK
jgi:hypothetical protein